MPKVSIIIPAYNSKDYIADTIDSVVSQTYMDFECIVVDDGSTDETSKIVSDYVDPRIRLIRQEKNSGGPSMPRNIGLAASKGEFVFIFDSDDIMQPKKIEEYLAAFKKNENIDFIFSDFLVIDGNGDIVKENFLADYFGFKKYIRPIDEDLYMFDMRMFFSEIIKANFIGASSVCFRRALLGAEKLFDESLSSGDDKLAWITLAKKAKFAFLDKAMHAYRKREASISTNNTERLLLNKIIVLDKIELQLREVAPHKDIIYKKNEYYACLGYAYRKANKFSEAKKTYWSIKGIRKKPFVIFQIIKVIIDEVFYDLKS